MPTPFYHLSVAQDLLNDPGLPYEVRHTLHRNRPAFFLGNTAPDVQTVSGQDRQATHFFDLPILPSMETAWQQLLKVHPHLAQPGQLPPAQVAFVAGYLCHLQADWIWVLEIFAPVFGPQSTWHTFQHRLYLHNVLRSYLDRQILADLPSQAARELEQASPANWLPFVEDAHLAEWRDLLARQLYPGGSARTVEVFAARQGLTPEAYYRLLDSEERLEQEVFIRMPRQSLFAYRQRLLEENARLLESYFSGNGNPPDHYQ